MGRNRPDRGAASRPFPGRGNRPAADRVPSGKSAVACGLYSCLIAGASYVLLAQSPARRGIRARAPGREGKGLAGNNFGQNLGPWTVTGLVLFALFTPVQNSSSPRPPAQPALAPLLAP